LKRIQKKKRKKKNKIGNYSMEGLKTEKGKRLNEREGCGRSKCLKKQNSHISQGESYVRERKRKKMVASKRPF